MDALMHSLCALNIERNYILNEGCWLAVNFFYEILSYE